jgi:hypothetical protein
MRDHDFARKAPRQQTSSALLQASERRRHIKNVPLVSEPIPGLLSPAQRPLRQVSRSDTSPAAACLGGRLIAESTRRDERSKAAPARDTSRRAPGLRLRCAYLDRARCPRCPARLSITTGSGLGLRNRKRRLSKDCTSASAFDALPRSSARGFSRWNSAFKKSLTVDATDREPSIAFNVGSNRHTSKSASHNTAYDAAIRGR